MKSQLFYTAHQLVEAGPKQAVSWFAVACYYHLLDKNELAQRYFLKVGWGRERVRNKGRGEARRPVTHSAKTISMLRCCTPPPSPVSLGHCHADEYHETAFAGHLIYLKAKTPIITFIAELRPPRRIGGDGFRGRGGGGSSVLVRACRGDSTTRPVRCADERRPSPRRHAVVVIFVCPVTPCVAFAPSQSTKLDGRFAPAWIGFGNAFAAQEETDQAVSAYRTAARLFQGSHLALLYIGE